MARSALLAIVVFLLSVSSSFSDLQASDDDYIVTEETSNEDYYAATEETSDDCPDHLDLGSGPEGTEEEEEESVAAAEGEDVEGSEFSLSQDTEYTFDPPVPLDQDNSTNSLLAVASNETAKADNRSSRPLTQCLLINVTQEDLTEADNTVKLMNGSHFMQSVLSEQTDSNVTNRTTPAICSLAFFFATWCPFSARAAPHFNALARQQF